MIARGLLCSCLLSLAAGCGGVADPREAEIAGVLADADLAMIRARPALVAGKYALMATDVYSFYRGSVPLYHHDWETGQFGLSASSFTTGAPPLSYLIGDAHPENFGILRARDVTFALEPNDFDSSDQGPYLWDLRRLTAGMSIAARLSNPDDMAAAAAAKAASRSIARAVAESYAQAMAGYAKGAKRARVSDGGSSTVIDDLFSRSQKDTTKRTELDSDTVLTGTTRKLRRGVLDPTAPYNTYADVPPEAYAALPAALEAYRQTLIDPPPPGYFTLLDAAREFGAGVASWPKVRLILLVRGPSDDPGDDVLLELKELTDADPIAAMYPPGVHADDNRARVLAVSRAVWAIPDADPLWGTATWMGLDVQIKTETDGEKTFRVKRLVGDRGTVDALTAAAQTLGALLARVHAAPTSDGGGQAAGIAGAIGADTGAFADEQADRAEQYADRVFADYPLFRRALTDLGPTLGVPADAIDTPPPDLAALYGTPPSATPTSN